MGRRGRSDHIPGRAPQACSPGSFPALPHGPGPDVQGPGSVGVLPRTGRGGGGTPRSLTLSTQATERVRVPLRLSQSCSAAVTHGTGAGAWEHLDMWHFWVESCPEVDCVIPAKRTRT